MLTLRRCLLHFPFHAPQIHLKETHMSHHRMTEVSARFPLLAYSQNILKKYHYSTRTLGAAENKAFSASISRILYHHISKLKTQRVVAWIHAVGSWPISMECWWTSSTTKAKTWKKITGNSTLHEPKRYVLGRIYTYKKVCWPLEKRFC